MAEVNIVLRDRKTHNAIGVMENWARVRYAKRRYQLGTATIDFIEGSVTRADWDILTSGSCSISIDDSYYGRVTKVIAKSGPNKKVVNVGNTPNEAIVLGAQEQAERLVTRYSDALNRIRYGLREISTSYSQLTRETTRLRYAKDLLTKASNKRQQDYVNPRFDIGLFKVTVHLQDPWGYVEDRIIDTTNVPETIEVALPAGEYIRTLLINELFVPRLPHRILDVNAELGYFWDGPGLYQVRNRWKRLNNVVNELAEVGNATLSYELKDGSIIYSVLAPNERRTSEDKLIITEQEPLLAKGISIGDIGFRATWLNVQTDKEPINEVSVICTSVTSEIRPGRGWQENPELEDFDVPLPPEVAVEGGDGVIRVHFTISPRNLGFRYKLNFGEWVDVNDESATTWLIRPVQNEIQYRVEIQTLGIGGYSPSGIAYAYTSASFPDLPDIPDPDPPQSELPDRPNPRWAVRPRGVFISWMQVPDIEGYEIKFQNEAPEQIEADVTTWTRDGLDFNREYFFRIRSKQNDLVSLPADIFFILRN